ncbi:MAG: hypothetical protein SOZ00_02345 [Tidjanibacter sp.]|nr:hypothetical protein [Tidjanibacter sp.]
MKKTFLICLLCLPALLHAQQSRLPNSWSIDYTTEGLYNVSNGRATWINILDAGFVQSLPLGFEFELNLLSVNNLRSSQGRGGVTDGLHIFSDIEDESVPLSLFLMCLSRQIGAVTLYAGVRNLNADYFDTPWNSVFTSSVNGLYPCISANYPIADSPLSALALHTEIAISKGWQLQASLYNGVASDRWDEVFRFRPNRDGVFVISELSYEGSGDDYLGSYRIGGIWGNPLIESANRKEVKRTLWTLIEQPLWRGEGNRQVELILHGGLTPKSECDTYFGGGGLWRGITCDDDYLGAMYTRSMHSMGNESAYELTYAYPVEAVTIQTALHYVHSPHHDNFITMVKMVFSL